MEKILLIFIIIQSLLIALAFATSSISENKPLVIYFLHICLTSLLFGVSENSFDLNTSGNEFIRVIYEFISLCRPAVIVSFLYFLLNKRIPKIYHFLWLLPFLNFLSDFLFKAINAGFYNAGFYENWYLNFPFYTKILLLIVLFKVYNVFKYEIKTKKDQKTHDELIKIYWGKNAILMLLILSSTLVFYTSFTLMNGRIFDLNFNSFKYTVSYYNFIHHFFTALFLFVFSYLLFKSSTYFKMGYTDSSIEQKIIEMVLPSEEKTVVLSIDFTQDQIEEYAVQINRLMEVEKVFLDSELTLDKLAEISGIKSRALSQFIQLHYQKKYKDFINSFRVLEAQKNLIDTDSSTTMFSIALDSGFNSESTFYKVFKEHTSVTPKQFREKLK
jgi:AraC-like DNA-binding protein